MRHRDDDLSRFREDPVVQALDAPATEQELMGEAQAVAAFREANPAPVRRRSGARAAVSGTAAVFALALSGGVAAAYTNEFPTSVQQDLHDTFKSIGVPAPHHRVPSAVTTVPVTPTPAPATPIAPVVPTHTQAVVPPPQSSPPTVPSSVAPSPSTSPTLPVEVETPTTSPAPTPTSTSNPTSEPPATSGQLAISVSATRVTVGQEVSVTGKLTAADGSAVADRPVGLAEHIAGERGWQRVGVPARTSADGQVSFSVPPIDRNVRLVLHARPHLRSSVVKVVVVPIINIEVSPTPAGATAATVTVRVNGAQPGDIVIVRQEGSSSSQQAKLDASLDATFSVPASQTQTIHYRLHVPRTTAHAAHSLPFYVPPTGG